MNALRIIARLLLLALVCAWPTACTRQAVTITHASFGIYRAQQTGRVAFEPAQTIPYAVGQQYGWLIQIRTAKPEVLWREELTLPAAPQTWGEEPVGKRVVGPDHRSLITERRVSTRSGYLFNAWKIEAGDPRGRYSIKVTVENGPSRLFVFDVK